MKITPNDYSIYLTHVGSGYHQLFIKNISAEADFIRIIIGYTELVHGKRVGKVIKSWIISPLQPGGEQVYLAGFSKVQLKNRRIWVAFEAVRRGDKNNVVGKFFALSPSCGRLRTSVGAHTNLDVRMIESVKLSVWDGEPFVRDIPYSRLA